MKRNIKTLGLAVAVVVVVTSLASPALSDGASFHNSHAPLAVTGIQSVSHVWGTSAGVWTCKISTFSGVQAVKTSGTMKLAPNYDNCTVFGFINMPVHENGCMYNYAASGTTGIECPAGKSMEITGPGCVMAIGSQHLPSGMSYGTTGTTPNRHLVMTINIAGFTYDECGIVRSNGTYKGQTTLDSPLGTETWVS